MDAITEKNGEKNGEKTSNDKSFLSGVAYRWLHDNALAFDTETTGLGDQDQIIEMALVNRHGQTLLNCRFKPTVPINPNAQAVHGISADDLKDKVTFDVMAGGVLTLLKQSPLIIFNADYDLRLLKQTCDAFGVEINLADFDANCAMKLAADYYGATNRHGTISLANAMDRGNVEWEGNAHSAEADALATMNLVKAMAFDPVTPFYDETKIIENLLYQIDVQTSTVECLKLRLDHYLKRGIGQ